MKKYFLLATVAGCVLAGNAVAGTIATDGQSATINVKAILKGATEITDVEDIDFGTILYHSGSWKWQQISDDNSDIQPVAVLSPAGGLTLSGIGTKIIAEGAAGSYTTSGYLGFGMDSASVSITCVSSNSKKGYGSTITSPDENEVLDATSSGNLCHFGSASGNAYIGNITTQKTGDVTKVGGTLYIARNYTGNEDYSNMADPALRITLNY